MKWKEFLSKFLRNIKTSSALSRRGERGHAGFPVSHRSVRVLACQDLKTWLSKYYPVILRSPVWRKTLIRKIDNFDWFWLCGRGPVVSGSTLSRANENTVTEWAGRALTPGLTERLLASSFKHSWNVSSLIDPLVWANLLHPVIFKLTSNLMIIITP